MPSKYDSLKDGEQDAQLPSWLETCQDWSEVIIETDMQQYSCLETG
jgi:hypothetical protein